MQLITRLLFQVIGYVCVATVFSALLGVGYLWKSGKLTNEKVFHISALLHDVDLEEIAEMQKEGENVEVPPEESSLEAMQRGRALLDRNHEIKSGQLARQITEFKHIRDLLAWEMDRRDKVAQALDARLTQAEKNAINEGNAEVARQLNLMKPEQVKDELMKMIENDEMDNVVPLLSQMPDTKLKKVLEQFKSDPDITTIHALHQLMATGFPKKDVIDQTKQDLQELQADQK